MQRAGWIVIGLIVMVLAIWSATRGGKSEDEERGWQPDLRSAPEAASPVPPAVDAAPPGGEGGGAGPAAASPSPTTAPRGGRVQPGRPGLPLADVRMPLAQWTDARLMAVLEELAEVAGKRLIYGADTRQRARTLRVTLERRDATVANLLDLVLGRREDLNWTMRGGAIEIYLDDE